MSPHRDLGAEGLRPWPVTLLPFPPSPLFSSPFDRDCLNPSRSGWIGSPSWFVDSIYYFSMLPSLVWYVCSVWVAPGWSIPWVCLSAGICSVGHNLVTTRCPVAIELLSRRVSLVATRLLSRRASPLQHGCRGTPPDHDGIATARGDATVPMLPQVFPWPQLVCWSVPQGKLSLRTFRWGTRQVTSLRLVTEGDTFMAVSWGRCQETRICLIIDCLEVNRLLTE
ncbi:hypothetical protein Taro_032118 [Colocasia esculenta]|uniref:Uncharacterized protein n=1 Tax=Colocasia esculenta TaxID=4460 RepID=A0A843VWF6_COLES|nr:hypothetical protein [Colocasia esculenta]